MKTIEIGKYKVELYDSIDELPIKRFHKFNKYLLVDAGVGSDLNDINEKIGRIMRFVELSDKVNANMELENLRQALYLVSQGTNVRHLALMVLIKSVDGVENSDLSDEKLRFLQKQLGETSVGFFNRLLQSVKKKIDNEINLYFPGQFDDAAVKEYHDKLRFRILFQLDSIIRNADHKQEIDQIDDFLLTLAKPKVFSGKESTEIKYDRQFEDMCLFLSHELSLDIDKLSVLQFYNSFEYIKKHRKNHGRQSH
mgnify:CR=1 FL=1